MFRVYWDSMNVVHSIVYMHCLLKYCLIPYKQTGQYTAMCEHSTFVRLGFRYQPLEHCTSLILVCITYTAWQYNQFFEKNVFFFGKKTYCPEGYGKLRNLRLNVSQVSGALQNFRWAIFHFAGNDYQELLDLEVFKRCCGNERLHVCS